MFASFVFSLLAGLLVVHLEPPLKDLVAKYDRYEMKLDAMEFRILTFCLLMALAALATWLVGGNSSAFLAVIGGGLGYFGPDLYAFLRDPDGAFGDEADDWDGAVIPDGAQGRDDDTADEDDETLRAVKAAVWPEDDRSAADAAADGAADHDKRTEEETSR